jgi:folate-binding protein YgfZ
LTVKGKLVSELLLTAHGEDGVDLLVPSSTAQEVAELLERHIIMDDVELEPVADVHAAVVWSNDDTAPGAVEGAEIHRCRHPLPGYLVTGEPAAVEAALAGLEQADAAAFDARRIETATPAWGFEIEPGHFPPEVGFVYAVSYDKGCYMGQEPLARIHARGQVNWVMVRVASDAAPPTGPVELSHPDREVAGRWTTSTIVDGSTAGLAIVRREFAQDGTVLHTKTESSAEVRVVSGPLGDDPGMGKSPTTATVKLGAR